MSLNKLVDEAVGALEQSLPDTAFSDQKKQELAQVIEKILIKTVQEAASTHHHATVNCCGPEVDIAHKIREEVERANKALIANLMAMR